MIRSMTLEDAAKSVYTSGKEFLYDHVTRSKVVTFKKGTETRINIKVDAQRRSLKAILLLFMEGYTGGARDSEKYVFPDLTKVSVTINGHRRQGHVGRGPPLLCERKNKTEHMNLSKFYAENNFGLVIDMRSMVVQAMHGSGTRIVSSTDRVQLEIERNAKDSGDMNCHYIRHL